MEVFLLVASVLIPDIIISLLKENKIILQRGMRVSSSSCLIDTRNRVDIPWLVLMPLHSAKVWISSFLLFAHSERVHRMNMWFWVRQPHVLSIAVHSWRPHIASRLWNRAIWLPEESMIHLSFIWRRLISMLGFCSLVSLYLCSGNT